MKLSIKRKLVFLYLLLFALNLNAQKALINKSQKSFPVIGLLNDTLFSISERAGSFSPKERAFAITQRINKIADNNILNINEIETLKIENDIDLIYQDEVLMSISIKDAASFDLQQEDLANQIKNIISSDIKKFKYETSFITILKEIGLAILTLFILVIILILNKKLFKYIASKILEQQGKKINGINIKNYTLFDAHKEVKFLITLSIFLKWIVNLIIIYITLPILFGIFPWTKNLAKTLFGYIIEPIKRISNELWEYLPNLFTIIIILFVFKYILRGLNYLKTEIEDGNLKIKGFYPDWANSTHQIIKILIYAFMLIVIFPYLPGSDSTVFKGVSVFLGVLFSFGSAGSLSNIIAGLVITYMRLFKIGDRVKIGDVVGDIIEKTLLVTRIRTIKNEIISIPNSTIMNSHTINYSSDAPENGLIIHSTVTIGYDVPWKDMHSYLIEAAKRTNLIEKKPEPFVLQTSLDDFYVSYQINAYTKSPNKQAIIYSDLHQNIQDVCNENNIEIMSPHYRGVRDGNDVAIPKDYKSSEYKKPTFDININNENRI